MNSLRDKVTTDEQKTTEVVEACCTLLEAEVEAKSGVSGFAIKAAYKILKGVKPGFVRQVVVLLLPEFAEAMDPLYQEAKAQSRSMEDYWGVHTDRSAEALLQITDRKAEKADHALLRTTYNKLRGIAKKQVEIAIPKLGRLVDRHVG